MKTQIKFYSSITLKLLYKLKYKYKNIYKDIFIKKNIQWNIIKYYKVFKNKIEKLKSLIFELNKNNTTKLKIYLISNIIRNNY